MSDKREVRVRRVYDDPEPGDGTRVLVDRLWPRGVTKERAHRHEWCKQVAPSTTLRTWYALDPERCEEFARRYRQELTAPVRAEALTHLRALAQDHTLTLLTASKAADVSEPTVLAEVLR